jgi:hypothetical protein
MARSPAGHFLLEQTMKGTKFSSVQQFNELLAAVERLEPEIDIDPTDIVAVILHLLANGWEVTLPHHDDASSSSPVTTPSIFQENS